MQLHKQNKIEHQALRVLPTLHGINTDLKDLVLERRSDILEEFRDTVVKVSRQLNGLTLDAAGTQQRASTPSRELEGVTDIAGVSSVEAPTSQKRPVLLPPSPERASKRIQSRNIN